MKIFCIKSNDPKIIGIAAASKAQTWDKQQIPVFDLMSMKPDIVLVKPSDIVNNDVIYAMEDYPDTRFILLDDGLIKDQYTPLERIELFNMPYLASETIYGNGKYDEKFKADISVFSDNLDEKYLDWINPLFEPFNIKIYGSKKMNTPLYLGSLDITEYKTVLASSSIHLAFEEHWINNSYLNNCLPIVYSRNKEADSDLSFNDLESLSEACVKGVERLLELKEPLISEDNKKEITYESFVERNNIC